MTKLKCINLISFNVLWFACTTGVNSIAIIGLCLFYLIHVVFLFNGIKELLFTALFFLAGYTMETLVLNLNLIHFNGSSLLVVGESGLYLAPVWLACLWVGFSTTVIHGLSFLHGKTAWIIGLCCLGIPWNYYFGSTLSGSSFPLTPYPALLVEAVLWSLLLIVSLHLAKRYDLFSSKSMKVECDLSVSKNTSV